MLELINGAWRWTNRSLCSEQCGQSRTNIVETVLISQSEHEFNITSQIVFWGTKWNFCSSRSRRQLLQSSLLQLEALQLNTPWDPYCIRKFETKDEAPERVRNNFQLRTSTEAQKQFSSERRWGLGLVFISRSSLLGLTLKPFLTKLWNSEKLSAIWQ